MSLTDAIYIGRSALNASQLGLQVTSNNLANAATIGYSRQIAYFAPIRGDMSIPGLSIGRGVMVTDVRRQVDTALQARLWGGISDEMYRRQQYDALSAVESSIGELTDNDVSSELSTFFKAWSELANKADTTKKTVVEEGIKLSNFLRRQREDLAKQRDQMDEQLAAGVERVNQLLRDIANLNQEITNAELGAGQASPLRDQRDQAISDLSQMMDVHVVDRGSEGVDVLSGSTPLVLGSQARPLEFRRETQDGEVAAVISIIENDQEIVPSSGLLGGLLASRGAVIDDTIEKLDRMTSQLIFEVNKLHSVGSNANGFQRLTGTLTVGSADQALAINNPNNQAFAGLPFAPQNGTITVRVKNSGSDPPTTTTVDVRVDLDGVGADSTPEDIRAALDAVPGINATFTAEGKLDVRADAGFDFSFTSDSSGLLATMGVNSYFTGTSANDIAIRQGLVDRPDDLAAGSFDAAGLFTNNATAMAIVGVQDLKLEALGNVSVTQHWRDSVQTVAVAAASAKSQYQSASVVRQSLDSQRAAISGVSIDEESINLMSYQRQYQAAARVIDVSNRLLDSLLNLT